MTRIELTTKVKQQAEEYASMCIGISDQDLAVINATEGISRSRAISALASLCLADAAEVARQDSISTE